MFDISEAYTGAMVAKELPTNGLDGSTETAIVSPQTADEILQYAREEAAEILEKAREEADLLVTQRVKEINEEADKKIVSKVNKTYNALGEDLFSARAGIAEIVEESMHLMIGAIGTEKVFFLAVDKATKAYTNSHNLKIHAHPDSANRLRLYNISNNQEDGVARYEIIDDTNLEADRCLLDTGEKRIEVSLELQIQAIKKSLQNNFARNKI